MTEPNRDPASPIRLNKTPSWPTPSIRRVAATPPRDQALFSGPVWCSYCERSTERLLLDLHQCPQCRRRCCGEPPRVTAADVHGAMSSLPTSQQRVWDPECEACGRNSQYGHAHSR